MMTYTITISEPKEEHLPEKGVDFVELRESVESILHNSLYEGTKIDAAQEIARVYQGYLRKHNAISTVSLEWTTEAPKVAGLYLAEWYHDAHIEGVNVFEIGGLLMYSLVNDSYPISDGSWVRWLGPIPLPVGGG